LLVRLEGQEVCRWRVLRRIWIEGRILRGPRYLWWR